MTGERTQEPLRAENLRLIEYAVSKLSMRAGGLVEFGAGDLNRLLDAARQEGRLSVRPEVDMRSLPPTPMPITPAKWLRSGELLYTLYDTGDWRKGEAIQANRIMVRVTPDERADGAEQDATLLTSWLHGVLNAPSPPVAEGWRPMTPQQAQGQADLCEIQAEENRTYQREVPTLNAEITRLRQENDTLKGALEPFAEAVSHLHPALPDDGTTLDGFLVSDFRRAAAALKQPSEARDG